MPVRVWNHKIQPNSGPKIQFRPETQKFTRNCEFGPENSISGPESTLKTELGPISGPKSQNSGNFWSETRVSGQESQNQSSAGDFGPHRGPKFPENSTKIEGLGTENPISGPKSQNSTEFGSENCISGPESAQNPTNLREFGPENSESVPKLATILEETQEELHTEAGDSPCQWIRDFSETECEPQNQNFSRSSGPMVRMPLYRTLRREFASSNPTGVPKVHCTPTLEAGTPKVHCTPTLEAGTPKVLCTLTLAPGSPPNDGTLAREETEKKNKIETSLETMRSEVLDLENQVGMIRDVMLDNINEMSDDKAKIENQTQTLDSVTQRVSQTETFLEDKVSMLKSDIRTVRGWFMDHAYKIETQTKTLDAVTQRVAQTETFVEETTSKVSSLEFDVSNVRGMLLDDENKIEIQTQTLESVTQRLSRTETVLEDITSKVSMLEYDVSVFRKTLLDDENKIDNQAQTLNSVTKRLLQCESDIRTLDSDYVSLGQTYKMSVASNDLLERRLQE